MKIKGGTIKVYKCNAKNPLTAILSANVLLGSCLAVAVEAVHLGDPSSGELEVLPAPLTS